MILYDAIAPVVWEKIMSSSKEGSSMMSFTL